MTDRPFFKISPAERLIMFLLSAYTFASVFVPFFVSYEISIAGYRNEFSSAYWGMFGFIWGFTKDYNSVPLMIVGFAALVLVFVAFGMCLSSSKYLLAERIDELKKFYGGIIAANSVVLALYAALYLTSILASSEDFIPNSNFKVDPGVLLFVAAGITVAVIVLSAVINGKKSSAMR